MVSASEFKSEDPGFDPLAEQGDELVFSVPSSQLLCRLVYASPPFVCTARQALKFVRTLKILCPSVVKEEASQPVVWSHIQIQIH